MHNCQDIEENICFSNGSTTNLHIHAIAQGRPEDNQVEFIQRPHGIVNPPKNLVLNNIRRFTQMANGLQHIYPFFSQAPPDIHWNSIWYHRLSIFHSFECHLYFLLVKAKR